MDNGGREPFQARWERLKQHLDEAKGDRSQPLFRFSLASFLVVTAATGVTIGCIVRLCGSDGVALLALVAIIILYFAIIVGGFVVYLWLFDLDVGQRSGSRKHHPGRSKTSTGSERQVGGEGLRDHHSL